MTKHRNTLIDMLGLAALIAALACIYAVLVCGLPGCTDSIDPVGRASVPAASHVPLTFVPPSLRPSVPSSVSGATGGSSASAPRGSDPRDTDPRGSDPRGTGFQPVSPDPGEYFYAAFRTEPFVLRIDLPVPPDAGPDEPPASRWAVWLDCGDVLAVRPSVVFANAWGDRESFPGVAVYGVSAQTADARIVAVDVTRFVPAARPATRLLGLYLICPGWHTPQLRAARLYRLPPIVEGDPAWQEPAWQEPAWQEPAWQESAWQESAWHGLPARDLTDLLLCLRAAWSVSPSDLFAADANTDGLLDADDIQPAVTDPPESLQDWHQ